ncbi:hypothetical protein [Silvimonas soli]|uniref:hypothetical protein n=1 Tax=Silvimonas soli TaxID=2980100 RepID=UPI0024B339AD|nr:hypothetical protein [Silvimonas soli]
MTSIEQLELDAQRQQLLMDVRRLVEKYQSIFGWDIPDIDQAFSDKLIIAAMRKALDTIEREWLE